jgi:hypothetical protein
MKRRPLTFEQTRGTKTYHLPFGKGQQPRFTLMVRRLPDGTFHAGVSICAHEDLFTRQGGRSRAFHRLNGRPITAPDSVGLFGILDGMIQNINDRRPSTVPDKVKWDLMDVCHSLNEAFDSLETNRVGKFMRHADALIGESIELTREVNLEIELPTEEGYEVGGC